MLSSPHPFIQGLKEDEVFLEEVAAIATQICEKMVRARDGSHTWIGPSGYGTELNPLRLSKLGPYLYDGTSGVALFLAAASYVLNYESFGKASLQAIAPLRHKLRELESDPDRARSLNLPLGGFIGLGSLIYGFLKIGEWLNEPALLREAHAITNLITPERIHRDDRVRVQTGSAGAVLALIALNQKCPERNGNKKTPLDLAQECGEHLLNTRVTFEGRPKAWPLSPGKPPLAGFSYGAAGISFALLNLYEKVGDQRFLQAAQEGLAFLEGLYSQEGMGWLDMRALLQARYKGPAAGTWKDWWASGDPNGLEFLERLDEGAPGISATLQDFPTMWCHGSSGIALAQLGTLHLLDSPEIRRQITTALSPIQSFASSHAVGGRDDLCCGHMGRADVLKYASEALGRVEFVDAAKALAYRVVMRARKEGCYEVSSARGTDAYAPSLFQGVAGIGYTLLRLASAQPLPCILLLE